MSPAQPSGDPAPADGLLPPAAVRGLEERTFSLYVHVPYCSVRCGYCDFNTYAVDEFDDDVGRLTFARDALAEIDFAAEALRRSGAPPRPLHTVFFGGGTPTRIPAEDLAAILTRGVERFGLMPGAEVTTEANPDSVNYEDLRLLRDAGFTRISFGMQSAVPRVLRILERTHHPENVPKVVAWAKELGLRTSLDLIYGAPTETLEEWERSLREAMRIGPDHLSAYSLIVEPGTRMAVQVRRGEYPEPDEDLHADMYLLADRILAEHGYGWYEVSNWARTPRDRSEHNLVYWRGQDWWGIGPGAHSHVQGVRWWNVKHPMAYAHRVHQGISPAAARETLGEKTRYLEEVMLTARIREGLSLGRLSEQGRSTVGFLTDQGLVDARAAEEQGRLVLTLQGRLLGDAVVRELLPEF